MKTAVSVLVPLLLLNLLACRKGKPQAPTELKAPAAPFHPISGAPSEASIKAEAEVVASSGPVELTYRVYKSKIKTGEYPWHQIQLKNIGDQKLVVTDEIFRDPRALQDHSPIRPRGGIGIYVEATGPDGKPLDFYVPREDSQLVLDRDSGLLNVDGPKEKAMVAGWKKQGLSKYEVLYKLAFYNMRKRLAKEEEQRPPAPSLKPGEKIETASWFYYNSDERMKHMHPPSPIGDFSRLQWFEFDKPGKYKVRAVYDYILDEKDKQLYKKLNWSTSDCILIRTPWIEVTVLP